MEKTFSEETQRISRKEMCQLKIRVVILENENEEIGEVLAKI